MISIPASITLPRSSRGFSLLELLITLVILSVGLLGIGLMQVTGLSFTKSAYSRTQAMLLASDIADRIRANEPNAASYATGSTTPGTPSCIGGSACSGTDLAASDLTDWSNRINAEFPTSTSTNAQIIAAGATPTVSCPSGSTPTAVAAGFMRVYIQWNERSGTTGVQSNQGGGETNGDCYQFDFAF